jgi:excisionase family DNA binding protein
MQTENQQQQQTERATLRVTDVARYHGVKPATVYRWAAAGKIPKHFTPGGQLRFKPSEIERKPE